jgi:hypothetical protein
VTVGDDAGPSAGARGSVRVGGSSARARRHGHLSAEARVARGKAARRQVPRSRHGEWEPAAGRPDPVGLLEEQAQSRVRKRTNTAGGELRIAADPPLIVPIEDLADSGATREAIDQNDRDYALFRQAVKAGRLAAQTGL